MRRRRDPLVPEVVWREPAQAGLLARGAGAGRGRPGRGGSARAFPPVVREVASRVGTTGRAAYSCGYSPGLFDKRITGFPFHPDWVGDLRREGKNVAAIYGRQPRGQGGLGAKRDGEQAFGQTTDTDALRSRVIMYDLSRTSPSAAMRFLLVLLALLLLFPAQPRAQTETAAVSITEWAVPWAESRPRDPITAADGRVWFVGQRSDYVASLDPETGEFERIDLEPGAGPHNVIVGPDGALWYAGNRAMHIGRIDPATGEITRFPMPDERVRDPHTMIFGPTGHLWFTAQGANHLGRLDPATGEVDVIVVPTERARPYGIVIGPDGTPWVVAFGTNKLLSVNPETLALREHVLPRAEARPRRLGMTTDGAVWYVDYAAGHLGRFDPATEAFEEWAMPGGAESRPYAMAVDDRDRLWFFETGAMPNRLVGFDPATEAFIEGGVPESGGGTVRHMIFDPVTRALWFGTDTNTIGRAILP